MADQANESPDHLDGERPVIRLVGVYDADGSARGELAYWIGARLGRAHCALCDITHGLFRERVAWKQRRAGLPVPFKTFHRDDQPDNVRRATGDRAPSVVAETEQGVVVLLGAEELEACASSAALLVDAIGTAVAREGLTWP